MKGGLTSRPSLGTPEKDGDPKITHLEKENMDLLETSHHHGKFIMVHHGSVDN